MNFKADCKTGARERRWVQWNHLNKNKELNLRARLKKSRLISFVGNQASAGKQPNSEEVEKEKKMKAEQGERHGKKVGEKKRKTIQNKYNRLSISLSGCLCLYSFLSMSVCPFFYHTVCLSLFLSLFLSLSAFTTFFLRRLAAFIVFQTIK